MLHTADRLKSVKGELGYVPIRASKDPPNFLVILEDLPALLGILIAEAVTFTVYRNWTDEDRLAAP